MGMNHPGEIKVLADIAQPDAAIITNIGVAHIEYMGSREAIAKEKGTLAEAVPANGWVVLNANDEFTATITARTKARVVTAGVGRGDVSAIDLKREARRHLVHPRFWWRESRELICRFPASTWLAMQRSPRRRDGSLALPPQRSPRPCAK